MRRKAIFGLFIICALAATVLSAEHPMETYQRALVLEQVKGNLKQAIELYERAAREAGSDRVLAAKALIRAADCYQKLGEPRAAQLYQEVARAYPEQRAQVAAAQMQLAFLRRPTTKEQVRGPIPSRLAGDLQSVVVPMLNTYCISCHSQPQAQRFRWFDLDGARNRLTSLQPAVDQDADGWEKVLLRLRTHTHPPTGSRRPDESTNKAAIWLLETALDTGYPQPVLPADRASDLELASRLAKFLWAGEPDAALLEAARRGTLKDPATLQQQVGRMLRDPKSENLITGFFAKWLHLDDLAVAQAPPVFPPQMDEAGRQGWQRNYERGRTLFSAFDEELRQSMRRETELFIGSQIRDDRPILDLWTANYTFLNERLARHYGIPNVSGSQFRQATLSGDARAGLLGQGSILTLTSSYTRTSPTLRGKWINFVFLGFPIPPPPPNLDPLPDQFSGSVRSLLEEATSKPACASCHSLFDPMGFAMGNFDAIGRWQDEDGGSPVDASGAFVDGTRFNGPAQFRNGLVQYRDAYYTNVTQRLLAYALGRVNGNEIKGVYSYEMPAVRAILREAAANNNRWSSIVTGIAKSQPFQMKTLVP